MHPHDPAVLTAVTAQCLAYERALVANDVSALQTFFWDSPHAIRFGVHEQLYGAEQIRDFRQNRIINFRERQTRRLEVVTLGPDAAVAMLEFTVVVGERTRHGRQTQVWARFDVGWKVTAAHVSHAATPEPAAGWSAYASAAAAAVALPLDPVHEPGVVHHLTTTAGLISPLLAFALPPDTEPAPVFHP